MNVDKISEKYLIEYLPLYFGLKEKNSIDYICTKISNKNIVSYSEYVNVGSVNNPKVKRLDDLANYVNELCEKSKLTETIAKQVFNEVYYLTHGRNKYKFYPDVTTYVNL